MLQSISQSSHIPPVMSQDLLKTQLLWELSSSILLELVGQWDGILFSISSTLRFSHCVFGLLDPVF